MQKSSSLIHTKLRIPPARPDLVARPRLQQQVLRGLQGPLTLIVAPAGFGKTTLAASCVAGSGMPAAWLSLDKDDNEGERFLTYMVAALQEADPNIGGEAAQLLASSPPTPAQVILTSLINDLDTRRGEIVLVLEDYQFISSEAVHEQVAFLLDHGPNALHLLIATRSDPPLPLARLRACGQTVELRAADLSFTEPEASQFLNEDMGLCLDAASVAALKERTEGWIAGLQMAALSMRGRQDVRGFIEAFSGTNRYILDYLLEEVLAGQPAEIQRFLLYTSILERLTPLLCDAVIANEEGPGGENLRPVISPEAFLLRGSASILRYLERANLFLVPLDDERTWYRYHHLFADLLRTQLQKSLGREDVARLHLRAAAWHEHNGSVLDAIHHASLAPDNEMVERLIEQHYLEMMNRGEMAGIRSWMGNLTRELVYRRPWLCLYEACSQAWFGELEEANLLLAQAEKRIQSGPSAPDARAMLGYHDYIQSRVSAMQGNTRRAIELCLAARQKTPADKLALQIEMGITLGYEYFLCGDFVHASQTLHEMIQSCQTVGAVNNPVAAYCLLARAHIMQGRLHEAYGVYQKAAQLTRMTSGEYLGVLGLVEVGIGDLLCEWNDVEAALARTKQGLEQLPLWGKADDLCLGYITLARIHQAGRNYAEAAEATAKAVRLVQTRGIFSEARGAVEAAQVRMWLIQEDWLPIERWAATLKKRLGRDGTFRFEDELAHMTQARVWIAQDKPKTALGLLSRLEESVHSAERLGRVTEILLLEALALQKAGEAEEATRALTKCLALAEPEGYVRLFLDEGQPAQTLLAEWAAHAGGGGLRDYAGRLLAEFEDGRSPAPARGKVSPAGDLVDPLSQRELEVLHLMAQGRTNQEIAGQLIVAAGTVKAHTASIYRKLDAANRTEAVARARQLGILP